MAGFCELGSELYGSLMAANSLTSSETIPTFQDKTLQH
jgi:hypothetical protein